MTEPGGRFPLNPDTAELQIIRRGEDEDPIHVIIYSSKEVLMKAESDGMGSCGAPSVLAREQTGTSLPPVEGGVPGSAQSKGTRRRASRSKAEPTSKRVKTSAKPRTEPVNKRAKTPASAVRTAQLASKENRDSSNVHVPSNGTLPLRAKENTTLLTGQAVAPSFSSRGPLSVQQPLTERPLTHASLNPDPLTNRSGLSVEDLFQNPCISLSGLTSPKTLGSAASRLLHSPMATSTPVSKARQTQAQAQVTEATKSSLLLRRRLQEKMARPQPSPVGWTGEQWGAATPSPATMASDSGVFLTSSDPSGAGQCWSTPLSDPRQTPVLKSPPPSSALPSVLMPAVSQGTGGKTTDRRGVPRSASLGGTFGKGLLAGGPEQGEDSGLARSLTHTQPLGEAHLGAICSGWAPSQDSSQPLPDSPLHNNHSSNSQDDGEMDKSLTGMVWLSQYTPSLSNKSSARTKESQEELPNSRPSNRSSRVCSCGNREGEPEKPEKNYKKLIGQALMSRQDRTMTPKQIRMWFIENYPYFKFHEKCGFWQNAIRHNLSSNDCFLKSQVRKKHWTLNMPLFKESTEMREARSRPGVSQAAMPRTQSLDSILFRPVGQQLIVGYPGIAGPSSVLYNNNNNNVPRSVYTPIRPRTDLSSPIPVLSTGPMLLLPADNPLLPSSLSSTPVLPKLPIPPLTSSSSTPRRAGRGVTTSKGRRTRASASSQRQKLKKTVSTELQTQDVLLQAAIQSGVAPGGGVFVEEEPLGGSVSAHSSALAAVTSLPAGLALDPAEGGTEAVLQDRSDRVCEKGSLGEGEGVSLTPTCPSLMRADNPLLTQAMAQSPGGPPSCLDTSTPVHKWKVRLEPPASPIPRHCPEPDSFPLADLSDLLADNALPHLSPEALARGNKIPTSTTTAASSPQGMAAGTERDNLVTPPSGHMKPLQTWSPMDASLALALDQPPLSHLLELPDDLATMDHGHRTPASQGPSQHQEGGRDWLGGGDPGSQHSRKGQTPATATPHPTSSDPRSLLLSQLMTAETRPHSQPSAAALLHTPTPTPTGDSHHHAQRSTQPPASLRDWPSQPPDIIGKDLHVQPPDIVSKDWHVQPPDIVSKDWHVQPPDIVGKDWHVQPPDIVGKDWHVQSPDIVGKDWHVQPPDIVGKDWHVQSPDIVGKDWHVQHSTGPQVSSCRQRHHQHQQQQQGVGEGQGRRDGGRQPCAERELLYPDGPPLPSPRPSEGSSGQTPRGELGAASRALLSVCPTRQSPGSAWHGQPGQVGRQEARPDWSAQPRASCTQAQAAARLKTQPSASNIRRSLFPQLTEDRTMAAQSLQSWDGSGVTRPLTSVPQHSVLPPSSGHQHSVLPPSSVHQHSVLPPSSVHQHSVLPPSSVHQHSVLPPSSVHQHIVLPPSSVHQHSVLPPSSGLQHSVLPPSSVHQHSVLPPSSGGGQRRGQTWSATEVSQQHSQLQHLHALHSPLAPTPHQALTPHPSIPHPALSPSAAVPWGPVCAPRARLPTPSAQDQPSGRVLSSPSPRNPPPPSPSLTVEGQSWPLPTQSPWTRGQQQPSTVGDPGQPVSFQSQHAVPAPVSCAWSGCQDIQSSPSHAAQLPSPSALRALSLHTGQGRAGDWAQDGPSPYQAEPSHPLTQNQPPSLREQAGPLYLAQRISQACQSTGHPARESVAVYQSLQREAPSRAPSTYSPGASPSLAPHSLSPQSSLPARASRSPQGARSGAGVGGYWSYSDVPRRARSEPGGGLGARGVWPAERAGPGQLQSPSMAALSPPHRALQSSRPPRLAPTPPVQFPPPSSPFFNGPPVSSPCTTGDGRGVQQEWQVPSYTVRACSSLPPFSSVHSPRLSAPPSTSCPSLGPFSSPRLLSSPGQGVRLSTSPGHPRTGPRTGSPACGSGHSRPLPIQHGSVGFRSAGPALLPYLGRDHLHPYDVIAWDSSSLPFPVGGDGKGPQAGLPMEGWDGSSAWLRSDQDVFSAGPRTPAPMGVGCTAGGERLVRQAASGEGDRHGAVWNPSTEQAGVWDRPPLLPDALLTASSAPGVSVSTDLTPYSPDCSFFGHSTAYTGHPALPPPHPTTSTSGEETGGSVFVGPSGSLSTSWQADDFLDSLMNASPPTKQLPHS